MDPNSQSTMSRTNSPNAANSANPTDMSTPPTTQPKKKTATLKVNALYLPSCSAPTPSEHARVRTKYLKEAYSPYAEKTPVSPYVSSFCGSSAYLSPVSDAGSTSGVDQAASQPIRGSVAKYFGMRPQLPQLAIEKTPVSPYVSSSCRSSAYLSPVSDAGSITGVDQPAPQPIRGSVAKYFGIRPQLPPLPTEKPTLWQLMTEKAVKKLSSKVGSAILELTDRDMQNKRDLGNAWDLQNATGMSVHAPNRTSSQSPKDSSLTVADKTRNPVGKYPSQQSPDESLIPKNATSLLEDMDVDPTPAQIKAPHLHDDEAYHSASPGGEDYVTCSPGDPERPLSSCSNDSSSTVASDSMNPVGSYDPSSSRTGDRLILGKALSLYNEPYAASQTLLPAITWHNKDPVLSRGKTLAVDTQKKSLEMQHEPAFASQDTFIGAVMEHTLLAQEQYTPMDLDLWLETQVQSPVSSPTEPMATQDETPSTVFTPPSRPSSSCSNSSTASGSTIASESCNLTASYLSSNAPPTFPPSLFDDASHPTRRMGPENLSINEAYELYLHACAYFLPAGPDSGTDTCDWQYLNDNTPATRKGRVVGDKRKRDDDDDSSSSDGSDSDSNDDSSKYKRRRILPSKRAYSKEYFRSVDNDLPLPPGVMVSRQHGM
jgi:hypothetical protein